MGRFRFLFSGGGIGAGTFGGLPYPFVSGSGGDMAVSS